MASDVMSVKEAAEHLRVTPRRIWKMLEDGTLHAARAEPILISRVDVERFEHVKPTSPGRAIKPSRAWEEILAFDLGEFANEAALDAWRRKVRPRADWRRFYAHRSVLSDLAQSRLLVASGLRAAAFHGVPVDSDEERFIGYVAASDLDELPVGALVTTGDGWNVKLGVVPDDSWRFGRSARYVDPVTAWLDLEDHRDRSARLMLEALVGSRD